MLIVFFQVKISCDMEQRNSVDKLYCTCIRNTCGPRWEAYKMLKCGTVFEIHWRECLAFIWRRRCGTSISKPQVSTHLKYIIEEGVVGGQHFGYFDNHHTEKLNKVTNPKKSWKPRTDLMRQDHIYDVRITWETCQDTSNRCHIKECWHR